jgi:hypothetical protein
VFCSSVESLHEGFPVAAAIEPPSAKAARPARGTSNRSLDRERLRMRAIRARKKLGFEGSNRVVM